MNNRIYLQKKKSSANAVNQVSSIVKQYNLAQTWHQNRKKYIINLIRYYYQLECLCYSVSKTNGPKIDYGNVQSPHIRVSGSNNPISDYDVSIIGEQSGRALIKVVNHLQAFRSISNSSLMKNKKNRYFDKIRKYAENVQSAHEILKDLNPHINVRPNVSINDNFDCMFFTNRGEVSISTMKKWKWTPQNINGYEFMKYTPMTNNKFVYIYNPDKRSEIDQALSYKKRNFIFNVQNEKKMYTRIAKVSTEYYKIWREYVNHNKNEMGEKLMEAYYNMVKLTYDAYISLGAANVVLNEIQRTYGNTKTNGKLQNNIKLRPLFMQTDYVCCYIENKIRVDSYSDAKSKLKYLARCFYSLYRLDNKSTWMKHALYCADAKDLLLEPRVDHKKALSVISKDANKLKSPHEFAKHYLSGL